MVRFLLVVGRGLLAGPLLGAAAGLLVAIWIAALGANESFEPYALVWVLAMGVILGGAVGLAIGVPSSVLLALVTPRLRDRTDAAVAGLAGAGTVGLVAGSVAADNLLAGLVFGLVCATMGGVVGGWVVFGRARGVAPRAEVTR